MGLQRDGCKDARTASRTMGPQQMQLQPRPSRGREQTDKTKRDGSRTPGRPGRLAERWARVAPVAGPGANGQDGTQRLTEARTASRSMGPQGVQLESRPSPARAWERDG